MFSPAPGPLPSPVSQSHPTSMPPTMGTGNRAFGSHHYPGPSYPVDRPAPAMFPSAQPSHPEYGRYPPPFSSPSQALDTSTSTLSSPGTPFSNITGNMSYESRSHPGAPQNPPFEKTKPLCTITTSRNQHVSVDINATISKGFFQVDQKWTCYRRNYFSVSCQFTLHPPELTAVEHPLYYQQANQTPEPIHNFFIAISAKTAVTGNEHQSEERALVQHTPKRDKASESTPSPVLLRPSQPSTPSLAGLSNRGYGGANLSNYPSSMTMEYPSYGNPPHHHNTPSTHTFERIQFVKATANNGKRRAQQQFYHIVVDLLADVGRNGDRVKIATTQSHPMVVRGRSPGHYKDNGGKGSFANGDSDRGPGSGPEAGGASGPMPPMTSQRNANSGMDWESSQGRGSQMGHRNYRAFNDAEYTSASGDSENSPPDSTSFGVGNSAHQVSSQVLQPAGLSLEQDSNHTLPAFPTSLSAGIKTEPSFAGPLQLPLPFSGAGGHWQPTLPPIPSSLGTRFGARRASEEADSVEYSGDQPYIHQAPYPPNSHSSLRHGETDTFSFGQNRRITLPEAFAAAS